MYNDIIIYYSFWSKTHSIYVCHLHTILFTINCYKSFVFLNITVRIIIWSVMAKYFLSLLNPFQRKYSFVLKADMFFLCTRQIQFNYIFLSGLNNRVSLSWLLILSRATCSGGEANHGRLRPTSCWPMYISIEANCHL